MHKILMQLENRNYKEKYIESINVGDKILTDPKDILTAEKEFYKTLYTQKQRPNACKDNCHLLTLNGIKLQDNKKYHCDKDMTI